MKAVRANAAKNQLKRKLTAAAFSIDQAPL